MSQDNDNSLRNSCPHQQPPRPPATAPQAGAVWVRRGGHRGRTVSQPETGKPHQDRDGLFQLDLAENKKRWSEQEEDTLSGKHSLESEAEHNKQLPMRIHTCGHSVQRCSVVFIYSLNVEESTEPCG